jgi:hypothetical protein
MIRRQLLGGLLASSAMLAASVRARRRPNRFTRMPLRRSICACAICFRA